MLLEFLAPETKRGVELDREPARFVSPVLEQRLSRREEALGDVGGEPIEPRVENDGVTSSAGDRHGVELKVAEPPDYIVRRDARPGIPFRSLRPLRDLPRERGPIALEQSTASEREAAGLENGDALDDAAHDVTSSAEESRGP